MNYATATASRTAKLTSALLSTVMTVMMVGSIMIGMAGTPDIAYAKVAGNTAMGPAAHG